MGSVASQITGVSTINTGADQRIHQSSESLAFMKGDRWPVNSPHKDPVTRKMFSCDDVIMDWNAVHDMMYLDAFYT